MVNTLRAMLLSGSLWLAAVVILLSPLPSRGAEEPSPPQLASAQPVGVSASLPQTSGYQLLDNQSMEDYDPPYGQYQGIDCQVASGWQRFWYDGPEPQWMDTRVFASSHLGGGHVEKIADYTSQMILSTEPYTAGLWQRVDGLTPGVGYGFHAAMLTIYQTSAPPKVHGTMIKDVGLDPTGGTDPRAPQVVWSEPGDLDEAWDIYRSTSAYAQGTAVTVFVRVTSPLASGGLPLLNQSFLDSAILAQTAQVSASSPPVSDAESFEVRWDNAVPSPGDDITIVTYDVQWQDKAEGVWHDWLNWTTDLTASFVGQWGHCYRFRARAWQHYPNGAHLPSPYRPEGDTQTCVGLELTGRVLDPRAQGVLGATITVLETGQTASSGPDGGFGLILAPSPETVSVAVTHPRWLAPPATYGYSVTPTATLALTWTMRPQDDAVVNGDFEADLADWWATLGAAAGVSGPVHTGRGAAVLARAESNALDVAPSLAIPVSLSQTMVLTDAWAPVLSFWYLAQGAGEEGDFQVALTVVTRTVPIAEGTPGTLGHEPAEVTLSALSPPLKDDGQWRHFWAIVDQPRELLTGTVTVDFRLWDPGGGEPLAVYLDDVTLGSVPGGPWSAYLPLVAR